MKILWFFTDNLFTNLENTFTKNRHDRKFIYRKSKIEFKNLFNKIEREIPNGKNYIKANNFLARYNNIFSIKESENDIIENEEENIHYNNSDGEISFSKDASKLNIINSKVYIDKEKSIINENNIKLKIQNSENLDDSAEADDDKKNNLKLNIGGKDKNETKLNQIKNRVLKKAFMIKSVEVSRGKNFPGEKGQNEEINKVNKKRIGSNVSNLSSK